QLLNNPEAYENNELIIFNRWGDIVYEAKPYNNDWMGQNLDGTDLPEGTYYFILRLNIPTGEIIRGDVTIVK
ncbi:MAG: gliding motility-associated C-terminal domain-containing protein, partial [Saprospiraceae bacterium]|nr:gliding motility-associated C-terminal domain-containing protein [Saprospiraceae bacterium]